MSFQLVLPDDFDEQVLAAKAANHGSTLTSDVVINLPSLSPQQHIQEADEIDVQQVNSVQNKESTPSCSTNSIDTDDSDLSSIVSDISSSIAVDELNHYSPCEEHSVPNGGKIDDEHIDISTPESVPQVLQEPEPPVTPTGTYAASPEKKCAAGASLHQCDNCYHSITSVDPLYSHNWTHRTLPNGTSNWICNHCNGRGDGSKKRQKISIIKMQQLKQMGWFKNIANVKSFDAAARDANISMHVRNKVTATKLIHDLLPWLAFKNTNENREACIRPHRYDAVPVIFFDDVEKETALSIYAMYSACVIETSKEGGCHVWVHTDRALSERERHLVQKYLHQRIGADGGSISGEHWGRLCGYKNWKRDGCWVNLLAATNVKPLEITDDMLIDDKPLVKHLVLKARSNRTASPAARLTKLPLNTGSSSGCSDSCMTESDLEWGWSCEMLAKGNDSTKVEAELYNRALERKKASPQRYAQRTVQRAMEHVEASRL